MSRLRHALILAGVLIGASPGISLAQPQNYPNRSVSVLVPFTAGGITDVLGRIVANALSERFSNPFIIDNKPGGGTVLAAVAASRAEPDGYTLLMAPNGTISVFPTLYKSLPYNPLKDFKPIALVGSAPFVLLANPDFPAKSVQELVKLAKAKPKAINYGSGGVGTNGDLFMEMLQSIMDFQMTSIAYRGSVPQLTDTMSGQVSVGFADAASATALVQAGKLRALAVSTSKRLDTLPDVPTLAEAGVPGFDAEAWQMLLAPSQTPDAIVNLLNVEANKIIKTPEMRERFAKIGLVPGGDGDVKTLTQYIRSETIRWGAVIKNAGLAGSL